MDSRNSRRSSLRRTAALRYAPVCTMLETGRKAGDKRSKALETLRAETGTPRTAGPFYRAIADEYSRPGREGLIPHPVKTIAERQPVTSRERPGGSRKPGDAATSKEGASQ